ncbi:MAG: hypothetical protein Q6370_020400 [Candidatus Sigynarchaeota archaeon]
MMAQFDFYAYMRFVCSSIFANLVVVAVLAGMLVMLVGLAFACMNRHDAMPVVAYGGILAGIFIALATQQFGAVPVTFDGVAKLGLATFPAGPVVAAYEATTTWLLDKIGWCANAMITIGAAWFLVGRGNGGSTPVKLVLLGVAITGIGSLVGTGGIITWIMQFAGVHAPVVG